MRGQELWVLEVLHQQFPWMAYTYCDVLQIAARWIARRVLLRPLYLSASTFPPRNMLKGLQKIRADLNVLYLVLRNLHVFRYQWAILCINSCMMKTFQAFRHCCITIAKQSTASYSHSRWIWVGKWTSTDVRVVHFPWNGIWFVLAFFTFCTFVWHSKACSNIISPGVYSAGLILSLKGIPWFSAPSWSEVPSSQIAIVQSEQITERVSEFVTRIHRNRRETNVKLKSRKNCILRPLSTQRRVGIRYYFHKLNFSNERDELTLTMLTINGTFISVKPHPDKFKVFKGTHSRRLLACSTFHTVQLWCYKETRTWQRLLA